jgi:hypothetical protein
MTTGQGGAALASHQGPCCCWRNLAVEDHQVPAATSISISPLLKMDASHSRDKAGKPETHKQSLSSPYTAGMPAVLHTMLRCTGVASKQTDGGRKAVAGCGVCRQGVHRCTAVSSLASWCAAAHLPFRMELFLMTSLPQDPASAAATTQPAASAAAAHADTNSI